MPNGIFLLLAGAVTFCWLLFMLDDYVWERKKSRGLETQLRRGLFGMRSEQAEYAWYSRGRYPVIILLTYLNSAGVIDSESHTGDSRLLPVHALWVISALLLLSILLIAIDGRWDRWRQRGLSTGQVCAFWSYFWLRYPVLILATITAAKWALQP